jgi:acetyl esterase/lipase
MSSRTVVAAITLLIATHVPAAEPVVLNLWPAQPPGELRELPPEADQTKPEDRLIAGRRIIKLGNVSTPQIAMYRPAPDRANGAAVVICPGGGHNILAYDLEGTEVAEWLSTLGVTGIVLKYRVPSPDPKGRRWIAAVQDAQRAMSLVRSRAAEWDIDPERIGICGFSAGGETAGLTSLFTERQYPAVDAVDEVSSRPDFALLIYAAGFAEKDSPELKDYVQVTAAAPPMLFVHAWDDHVSVQNPLLLASALKSAGVKAELHLYSTGGHGYGLRPTDEAVTHWADRAGQWLGEQGWLAPRSSR